MNSGTIIILIFGIIILLMLFLLYFINRLIVYKNRVIKQFSVVSGYLKENANLIENLNEYIKNNLEHEEVFMKKLSDAKEVFESTNLTNYNFNKLKQAEKNLLEFTMLEDVYPFLKKKDDYLNFKESIIQNKERIIYAFDSYDREVMHYNNYREKKLVDKIAKIFRFSEYDYYSK